MPLIKEINGEKVQTDEIDVLESGVEVIAKPPGKEPRSISQLSGGEKTLTAVALLMSIFRSKPSCFCVLDEVDAALDEGNVGRYNQVIRQFTDLSHFIVITHNKRTMQFADRLYGVTMQERGVSKRVSVKFDEVSSDGTISQRATRDTSASASAHGSAQVAASVLADRESEVGMAHTIAPEVRSESGEVDSTPTKPRKAPPKPQPPSTIQGALQRALASMREESPESAPAGQSPTTSGVSDN
jgi:energy-coupling factor transporter ATP-binding protein EcfA2